MKNKNGKLRRIANFQSDIDSKAKQWFIDNVPENRKSAARRYYNQNKEKIKKELREEYLDANPVIKEKYEKEKRHIQKLKIKLATGMTAATLAIVGGCISYNSNKDEISQKSAIQIEQEMKLQEGMRLIEEQKEEEENYGDFFQEARETNNTSKRDELITNQTKQIIVEAYNKENPENPITEDRLETLILNENILQKTDRLGNYTYERVAQNEQIEQTENQKLVKIGKIYDFRIDGETVAVFDGNSNVLLDKNVENQDMSFQKMVNLLKESENLKSIYKYPSNDLEKSEAEQSYKTVADKLLEDKENSIEKTEIEK